MKAKVKSTGEIVEVQPKGTMSIHCAAYQTKDGGMIPVTALEFWKEIDWEQRRYEIAKDILNGWASHEYGIMNGHACGSGEPNCISDNCKIAVKVADALIAELKKGGEE